MCKGVSCFLSRRELEQMNDDKDFWDAWDDLNRAIGRMLVAQPHQMSNAAAALEEAQKNFRSLLNSRRLENLRYTMNIDEVSQLMRKYKVNHRLSESPDNLSQWHRLHLIEVLKGIRDPSEKMLYAASHFACTDSDDAMYIDWRDVGRVQWQKMIDALIKEIEDNG